MVEIRIHGRGGQGSVTASKLIAMASFYDGQFSQGFPNFGVERRGAPVTAYVRIDDKFIRLRSQIYNPDYIIIQDPSLVEAVDVFAGAKEGTIALINTEKPASDFKAPKGVEIKTIAATKIAMQIIGKPIINTILLGAFAGLTGIIKIESVGQAITEQFTDEEIVKKNIEAAKYGFNSIKKK
ncbi:MAG: pyruvate ferredoxin oxidoreductase subunit gamma [Candidatus Buchananbacteria bacterium]|nr:pyruvate ferredoxin oxidoreductase subunit gamma [Candidatus Buchananbacteria bacterium]